MEFKLFTSKEDYPKEYEYLAKIERKAGINLQNKIKSNTFKKINGEDASLYFLEENNEIAGFGAIVDQDFNPVPEYKPRLAYVYVNPKFRGKRLSEKIIKFLEEKVKELGYDEVHIVTQHFGLYEKYGYEFIKKIPSPVHENDYVYVKILK